MRIYNRSFADIYALLAWPQRVILIAGALFLLFAIIYIPFTVMRGTADEKPSPVSIRGLENEVFGKLDPSIASDGDVSAMVFTALGRFSDEQAEGTTNIRLAIGNAHCNRWISTRTLFTSKQEELIGPDGTTPVASGIWHIETPTIAYDAHDKGREWKVYAYKYFWAKNAPLARLYGFIVSSTAPSLDGPWSAEEWAFSASPDHPPAPYAKMVQHHLDEMDPSLADVYFYARPSVLVVNDVMLMTLTAFVKGKDTADRVVMLASADHGRSWQYLGTPFRSADLDTKKYNSFAGASLIDDGNVIYLAVVPGDRKTAAAGTLLIPFADVMKAALRQDPSTKVPMALKYVPRVSLAPNNVGGGFAAYDKACTSGLVTSEFSGVTNKYELINTLVQPNAR